MTWDGRNMADGCIWASVCVHPEPLRCPSPVHYYNHYNKSFSPLAAVSHARISHGGSVTVAALSPNYDTRCQNQVPVPTSTWKENVSGDRINEDSLHARISSQCTERADSRRGEIFSLSVSVSPTMPPQSVSTPTVRVAAYYPPSRARWRGPPSSAANGRGVGHRSGRALGRQLRSKSHGEPRMSAAAAAATAAAKTSCRALCATTRHRVFPFPSMRYSRKILGLPQFLLRLVRGSKVWSCPLSIGANR